MKETYRIPVEKREDIFKAIRRLQKKAMAYEKTLICEEGEPYAKECAVFENFFDPATGYMESRIIGKELVEVFDLSIDGDIIKNDGYTVVAKIEHAETGNIVQYFGKNEKQESWLHIPAHCDHCNGNHGQKVTFLVESANGEMKQVGRTCLKDYCGIDPQLVGQLNQLKDLLLNGCKIEHGSERLSGNRVYDAKRVLALAVRAKKTQGYIKSGKLNSNRDIIAAQAMGNKEPLEADLNEAQEMIDGILAMSTRDAINSLLDVSQSIIRRGYLKDNQFGYLAYAPVAYERYAEKQSMRNEQMRAESSSEWLGEIGERITIEIASFALLTSWENEYGFTYMYKIVTMKGDVLIWYASKQITAGIKEIKATVKKHMERNGIKQTIVTKGSAV